MDRPERPDSFLNSNYYEKGYLDGFFVLAWIAVLAFLRELVRLGILEPFARSVLYRKDMAARNLTLAPDSKAANGNGHVNGQKPVLRGSTPLKSAGSNPSKQIVTKRPKGMSKVEWKRERSTLRFAEQGWQFIYYIVYWPLGFVSIKLYYP